VTQDASGADARVRLAALVDGLGLEPTPPAPCAYLPGRDLRLVMLRPHRFSPALYQLFLDLNFRRLGHGVYRPACEGCRECCEIRVAVGRFRASRAQRRCLRRNADVAVETGAPAATGEKHAVYRRYLAARHDGQMSGSWEEFSDFLHEAPPFTREVDFRVDGPEARRALAVPRLPRRGQPQHGVQGLVPPSPAARSGWPVAVESQA
jgi:arginyl-tRNA--protein-N-Asp/Glu arginylyltransferase